MATSVDQAAWVENQQIIQTIIRGVDGRSAVIGRDGSLIVSSAVLPVPYDGSRISKMAVGILDSNEEQLDSYVITAGKTLYVQRFSAGSETDVAGIRAELHVRDDSSVALDYDTTLICIAYVNGSMWFEDLCQRSSYVGDGNRELVIRRSHLGGGKIHSMTGWIGYEVTT